MVKQSSVTFPTGSVRALRLEGMFDHVEADGRAPAAVICHPHPLGGGTMHNAIVVAIARALVAKGVSALRFNFRGVGASEGVHDNGRGEHDDVAGALDWLAAQPVVDPRRLSLVGYSFGASVGLAHALADPRISVFAAVGLAVGLCDPDAIRPYVEGSQAPPQFSPAVHACPKLFITGERDLLAPPGELRGLVERLPEPKSLQIVPGADHFWWGAEENVGELVADFITGSGN